MICEVEVLSFPSMCCVFVIYKLAFEFLIHKTITFSIVIYTF